MDGRAAPETALRRLAPLLWAVKLGEDLSRDISLRQAALAPTPPLARALGLQSRQEAVHSMLFGAALRCLPRRSACPPRLQAALDEFGTRLRADAAAGRLAATLVGLQCVLEGLATAALRPVEGELSRLGERLVPLRPLILHQEEAHHRLGEVWVPRLAGPAGEAAARSLAAAVRDYAALGEAVAEAGLATFDSRAAEHALYARASGEHLAEVRALAAALEG